MYFKINAPQQDKYTGMGMINVSADLYLEKGDEGYEKYIAEHLVMVPVIPEGGYTGKVDEQGAPADQNDYDNWFKSLPTVQQLNPFCNHSIQFEHDVTEEEILWCFEWALGITHWNYLMDDLHCQKKDENGNPYSQVVNQPFHYSARKEYFKIISQLPLGNRSDYMNAELAKVTKAEKRLVKVKKVDFTKVKTTEKYKVK
ncbi:hypothetical protein ER57_03240 [Smithella sp. SCADC]|jgi:hypothetical protein|nr:hypothetical protein ER57_03240 [Smithella sp. SCADC]